MTTDQDVSAFREHPLWELIDATVEDAGMLRPRDSTTRHTIARAVATLRYVREFRSIDPHLFPSNRIDGAANLQGNVNLIRNQLLGWDQSGAMPNSAVVEIDSRCTSLMSLLRDFAWPALQRESRAAAISGAAVAFQEAAERSLGAIEEGVEGAHERLSVLMQEIESSQARSRSAEASMRQSADELAAALQSFRDETSDAINNALREAQLALQGDREQNRAAADAHLAQLSADAVRGQELVRLVGDQATGGGYQAFAEAEVKAARIWNIAGVAATLLAVAAVLYLFQHIETLTLQATIVRALLSLPLLGLAAYSFQQAARRQRQSVDARYRALDVLAIEPFTKQMTPEQQSQLRGILGERLFSAPPASKGDEKQEEEAGVLPTLPQAQALIDLVKLLRT